MQSQHHAIRGLPLWVGGGADDDGSGGFVSWDFNETLSKYLLSRCSHRTCEALAMSQMCNIS